MRVLLLLLAAALAALYLTVGLRFGYVTLTQTYMFNATGINTYTYRTLEERQKIGVTGSCKVNSGSATLYLYDPSGVQVGKGQICQKGLNGENEWTLNLLGGGTTGLYRLKVEFANFTGSIDLNEHREGGQ